MFSLAWTDYIGMWGIPKNLDDGFQNTIADTRQALLFTDRISWFSSDDVLAGLRQGRRKSILSPATAEKH
jgi:hypothetical protein